MLYHQLLIAWGQTHIHTHTQTHQLPAQKQFQETRQALAEGPKFNKPYYQYTAQHYK